MKPCVTKLSLTTIAALAGGAAFLWSGRIMSGPGPVPFISPASAWIGHPATPLSYAGVARRTTRRTIIATQPYRYAPAYPPAPYR